MAFRRSAPTSNEIQGIVWPAQGNRGLSSANGALQARAVVTILHRTRVSVTRRGLRRLRPQQGGSQAVGSALHHEPYTQDGAKRCPAMCGT